MQKSISENYGVRYYYPGEVAIDQNRPNDLYAFKAYFGKHTLNIEAGDSAIYVTADKGSAVWAAGEQRVITETFAVVFRGYQCGEKTAGLGQQTNLPYINGCSTKQIFHPERVGDPTFQQLTIPPHTSEQAHHIHPTARVVYVLDGEGYSIVGQSDNSEETKLTKGMLCVLDPMAPHHFRTDSTHLTVLPVHIYSSHLSDQNHPMFNGTKEV